MPLPTFKKAEDIPEAFRGEYEEKDGVWTAKVPDVTKLEETLGKVRDERKEAQRQAKEAAERAADLQRKLDVAEAKGGESDKKVGEMLARWEQDKTAAVSAIEADRDKIQAELRQLKLYDKAKQAFVDAGGRAVKADAALKLKQERLDLVDDRMVVKDAKGEVSTVTVADFWGKEFRQEMPEFFEGSKSQGGDARGGKGTIPVDGKATPADLVIANPLRALQEANAAGTS